MKDELYKEHKEDIRRAVLKKKFLRRKYYSDTVEVKFEYTDYDDNCKVKNKKAKIKLSDYITDSEFVLYKQGRGIEYDPRPCFW